METYTEARAKAFKEADTHRFIFRLGHQACVVEDRIGHFFVHAVGGYEWKFPYDLSTRPEEPPPII